MTVAGRRGVQSSASRAQLVLTTLGTTTSSGKASAASRGEQRLRGLAEAGLVGEQEGAVAGRGGRDTWAWWCISSQPVGCRARRGRLGQRHARWRAAVLEGAEQRAEQLPGRPAGAGRSGAARGAGEVGGQERVGELAGDDRLGDHPALGGGGSAATGSGASSSSGTSLAGAAEHVVLELRGGVGDDGVLGEQREQRGVAGGGLGQDRGDAVEPLELLGRARPR